MAFDWSQVIKPSGAPATKGEIIQFEQELGFGLPDDYWEFLLEYNGGRVICEHELVPYGIEPGNGVEVSFLYQLSTASPGIGVRESRALQTCTRLCLRQATCIGDDMGTGFYYLLLDGPERGSIFFTYKDDREMLTEHAWGAVEMNIPSTMVKIASSFTDLGQSIWDGRFSGSC